jgi:glycine/D-amino acid oxidase-like deaminating enzyme
MKAPEQRNYWLDTVPFKSGTEGTPPASVDVAVVGAGFTGLSAALELARRGAKVAVLEAQFIGWGASSRNGGMVLTGTKLPIDVLLRRYGRELAGQIYSASLDAIDFVETCVLEEGIDCDFERCGHLEVAAKPPHFEAYQHSAELLHKEFGHDLKVIPVGDLAAEIGSSIYYGGVLDPLSASINPARFAAGIAQSAMRAGAFVYEGTRVLSIEGRKLRTTGGDVTAREVLIATGAYTSNATPALHRRVVPVGSFIIATAPLPESLAKELNPRGRMIFDSMRYLHYFRLTPDRRILFGGRAAFFPENKNTVRRSAAILTHDLVRTYPQLSGTRIDYIWGGTLDFCFDSMPHFGVLDGLHYAAGFAGHGVAMASYLGACIARRICGEKDSNPFEQIALPCAPFGLYNGMPWFLPFAGAWYKFLDWVS